QPSCSDTTKTVNQTWSNGFLKSITNWANDIAYQANGLPSTVTHGSGASAVFETWSTDSHSMTRPAMIRATDSGASELWSTGSYAYDASGNVTQTGTTSYVYDGANRLVATNVLTSSTMSANSRYYDTAGDFPSLPLSFFYILSPRSPRPGGHPLPPPPLTPPPHP